MGPNLEHIIGGGDADEPLVTTVRRAIAAVAAAVEEDGMFSARSGRPAGDSQLRVTTAAFIAAQLEAARCWADADGAEPLSRLLDDAVTLIEPLIAAL